jgi:hypothetical protein
MSNQNSSVVRAIFHRPIPELSSTPRREFGAALLGVAIYLISLCAFQSFAAEIKTSGVGVGCIVTAASTPVFDDRLWETKGDLRAKEVVVPLEFGIDQAKREWARVQMDVDKFGWVAMSALSCPASELFINPTVRNLQSASPGARPKNDAESSKSERRPDETVRRPTSTDPYEGCVELEYQQCSGLEAQKRQLEKIIDRYSNTYQKGYCGLELKTDYYRICAYKMGIAAALMGDQGLWERCGIKMQKLFDIWLKAFAEVVKAYRFKDYSRECDRLPED